MSKKVCSVCGGDPEKKNSAWNECSHVQCPSRRKAWSESPQAIDFFKGPWPENVDQDPLPIDQVIKDDK